MNPLFDPETLPLRDIHLPTAVAWWPPAWGWWLLAAGMIAVAIVMSVQRYRRRRHRAAQRRLAALQREVENGADPLVCVQQASIVLRRFAITTSGADDGVAGRVGDGWLAYLEQRAPRLHLSDAPHHALTETPYLPPDKVGRDEACDFCRVCSAWIGAQPARV
jgi:hypothetical protein